jgi:hypothetical protein
MWKVSEESHPAIWPSMVAVLLLATAHYILKIQHLSRGLEKIFYPDRYQGLEMAMGTIFFIFIP